MWQVQADRDQRDPTRTRSDPPSAKLDITNMQNMNPALFCILILGFAYYLACCCIYHDMQKNMHNMPEKCKKTVQGSYSAYFAYCNMQNMLNMSNDMLQYANQYAEYATKYARK